MPRHAAPVEVPADSAPSVAAEHLPRIGDVNTRGETLAAAYTYRDPEGQPYAAVLRWEGAGGRKSIRQWRPRRDGTWVARAPQGKRWPYRADEVQAHKTLNQPLLIVEGEKAVHAAMALWPDLIATTWAGGSGNVNHAKLDWSWLRDWSGPIHLWPDDDVAGYKAMDTLGRQLKRAGINDLHVHGWQAFEGMGGLPDSGADVADLPVGTPYPDPEPFEPPVGAEFDAGGVGRIWPHPPTVRQVLESMGIKLRWDTRHQVFQWQERTGDGWHSWADTDDLIEDRLRAEIQETHHVAKSRDGTYPLWIGAEKWKAGLNAVGHDNQGDLFLEYVRSCQASPDIGPEALGTFLETLFRVPEEYSALAAWASEFLFLGPLKRAVEPGAKLDETPVLMGAQGLGKSSFLGRLFPRQRRNDWFGDRLELDKDKKLIGEAMQGKVIVEISEMAGSTQADANRLKAVMSSVNDYYRAAYARNPVKRLRKCIMVGTTNDPDFLPPDDENRRWVSVALRKRLSVAAIWDYLDTHRDALWAAAWQLHASGHEARLPEDLYSTQRIVNDLHVSTDQYLDAAINAVIDGPIFKGRPFDLFTLLNAVLPKSRGRQVPGKAVQNMAGSILRAKGYERRRRRVQGSLTWLWSHPQLTFSDDAVDPSELAEPEDGDGRRTKDWNHRA